MPNPDNTPLTLYKYTTLTEPYGKMNVENAVLHHRWWCPSPLSFNDPFDCAPNFYFGNDDKDRRNYVRRILAEASELTRYQRQLRRRELLANPLGHEALMKAEWIKWMEGSSVTCFCEEPDHPLMWGHYANSHRGVCLVFKEQVPPDDLWIAFRVNYSEHRPRVNLAAIHGTEKIEQALLTKSAHWSYEREHRVIDWRTGPGWKEFPPKALLGIILGARTSEEDEQWVRNLIARRPHLTLHKADLAVDDYRLDIRPA